MDKREKPIQKGKLRLEAISEYRSEIYGISIFWILLFHMREHAKFEIFDGIPVLHYLQEVVKRGNMGVDVFLFISGICLYFSFVKNQDILAFMKKRISRIMYPLLFTSVPLWLAYLVFHKITIWGLINRISLVQFWISEDSQVWFASVIMVFYLLYPYIYRLLFEKKTVKSAVIRDSVLIVLVVLVTVAILMEEPAVYKHISKALPRVPVFLTGCCFGKLVYEKKRMPAVTLIVLTVGYLLMDHICLDAGKFHNILERYSYWIGGVGITFLLAILFYYTPQWFNTVCKKWGVVSLEIYFAHIVILRVFRQLGVLDRFFKNYRYLELLLLIVFAYVWAVIAAKMVELLKGCIKKHQTN